MHGNKFQFESILRNLMIFYFSKKLNLKSFLALHSLDNTASFVTIVNSSSFLPLCIIFGTFLHEFLEFDDYVMN